MGFNAVFVLADARYTSVHVYLHFTPYIIFFLLSHLLASTGWIISVFLFWR